MEIRERLEGPGTLTTDVTDIKVAVEQQVPREREE